MTDNIMLEKMNGTNNIYESKYNSSVLKSNNEKNTDTSIFASLNATESNSESVESLNQQLAEIEANNGAILDGWNDFKEQVGIGTSVEKCDEAIEKYKNGEITYEEASEIIEEFGEKQQSSLNLFSNIATSIAAIGTVAAVTATIASGGLLAPVAIAIGAGAGALTKAGFKATDRATNEVEGDTLDGKQIAKDAISGAITGGTAVYTMGTAGTATSVGKAVAGCAKTGFKTGAISGASNYTIDCAFDDEKDFNAGEFLIATGESSLVGGTVGAIMGGINGSLHASGILNSGCNLNSMISASETTGISDVAANSACTTAYKVLTDRIRSVAA